MQGVQDVVAFARLVWQQLEITVEKMEEFLKMWLDFEDFKVSSTIVLNSCLTADALLSAVADRGSFDCRTGFQVFARPYAWPMHAQM